jgi:hypothetical protein
MVLCQMFQQLVFTVKPVKLPSLVPAVFIICEFFHFQGLAEQAPSPSPFQFIRYSIKAWLDRTFASLDRTKEMLRLNMLCLIVSVNVIFPLEASLAARFAAVVTSFWLVST